jgi:von Willebrand factor type D domain
VDLKQTPTCRRRVGTTMVFALATIVVTLAGSGVAPLASASAAAPVRHGASSATSSKQAPLPPEPVYMTTFTPHLGLPAAVKAPSPNEIGAFAALNALIDKETLFADAIIGMRVSLDRAQAAGSASAQLWSVRQANASAEYALGASRLVDSFPALQTNVARAFVADKMSVTLTPAQFATAKAKLLRGLPSSFVHLLDLAATAFQPSTVPEVALLRVAVLDTSPLQQVLTQTTPKALVLPAALWAGSVTGPEAHVAAALKRYADNILEPVAPSALGGAAGGLEPATRYLASGEEGHSSLGESLGEALHVATDAFEAAADGAKFAEEAETAEALEPAAEGLGYAFAAVAFNEANAAFGEGAAPGEGGGGGSASGSGAASYGEPHEQTFSGASYGFQAVGEFTLAKSTTDDLDIQVREQRFPGAADVALDTATAMRVGGNIVELAANGSGRLDLWVNRKAVAYGSRALAGGGKISVESPLLATVVWPDGTAVSVFSGSTIAIAHEVVTCNSSSNINVMVKVAPSRSGHLEGLLGDPGEAYDELVGGNGVVYSMDQLGFPWENVSNFDVLYHQFAQSWRISQQSSLFYYGKGQSTATFTDLAFPSKALTVASLTPKTVAAAEKDCKAEGITNSYLLSDCVYDLGLTGGRGICLAGAEARVQAATGGPAATALPESSGALPPSSSLPASSGFPTTTTTSPSNGAGAPLALGSAPSVAPAVAVDGSGTAYVVWQQSPTKLSFCKLPGSAPGCRPVTIQVANPAGDQFDGPPSVMLEPGHIYVLNVVAGSSDLDGINEWVSTDGGTTFSLEPHAVGFVGGNAEPAGPAIELPDGHFGAGYVIPGSNPAFQANSLATPTDQSEAGAPPVATLNPRPATAFTTGNLGGTFGAQLVGSPGVLGVFEALPGKGTSPCPSSASDALVYAYAPINTTTTPAELSASPGSSSPWRPLTEADCDGTDPAVGGGPSGLGVLETNEAHVPNPGPIVQYRHFSPSSGFGSAVTVATGEVGTDGTLSQDNAGDIFATWLDNSTGVDLAYSSDGGAEWSKPTILFSNAGNPSGITLLSSAVGSSGQGWAVYAVGKREYVQRFGKG